MLKKSPAKLTSACHLLPSSSPCMLEIMFGKCKMNRHVCNEILLIFRSFELKRSPAALRIHTRLSMMTALHKTIDTKLNSKCPDSLTASKFKIKCNALPFFANATGILTMSNKRLVPSEMNFHTHLQRLCSKHPFFVANCVLHFCSSPVWIGVLLHCPISGQIVPLVALYCILLYSVVYCKGWYCFEENTLGMCISILTQHCREHQSDRVRRWVIHSFGWQKI